MTTAHLGLFASELSSLRCCSAEPACGGVYVAQSGNITSPYYPDTYPNNKECEYVIRQPEGSIITLTFLRFNVEGSFDSATCYHDYLEVGRGISVSFPQW